MLRILQCVNNMHRAGLETMLMNYYRNMDRSRIQFDFLVHRDGRSDYDDEIEALGGRIYHAPRLYPQNYPAYFRYMAGFFKEHPEYKIIHSHIDAMSYLPLLAAKKAAVPVRIAHSHSCGIDRDFKYLLKQYFRFRLPSVATDRFSCGKQAGDFLFRGRAFEIIANAVDPAHFRFDEVTRQKKRDELGLADRFVVGHVGRLSYPKNHEFLFKIHAELIKKKPNALLLLVGTGEKEDKLKALAREMSIDGSVIFLGNRADVQELYQAMDVFVLPSLFEGVPVVGVEAQFSGLGCLFSSAVTNEVCFSKTCRYQKLSDSPSAWAEAAIALAAESDRNATVESSIYDIRSAALHLQERYERLADR